MLADERAVRPRACIRFRSLRAAVLTMLLAQMHLALMFFAAKVRKPVVVVWEQRSLRDVLDLDDKPHSLGVRDCTGGLGTTPFTGHYGARLDHGPSASHPHIPTSTAAAAP